MRPKTLLFLALILPWTIVPKPAAAVDVALVLLTDVSGSMEDSEFAMVKEGYRAAFSDPDIITAIAGNRGGVALAYVEFSSADQIVLVQGWDVLSDAASVRAFGEAVASAPRSSTGGTALAASIRQATRMLQAGEFDRARRIIDVASDHPTDGGRSAFARDEAVASGITINALPIIDDRPIGTYDGRKTYSSIQWGVGSMLAFYRRDVIGGAGSFLVEARDYRAFGEALKHKLLRELVAQR